MKRLSVAALTLALLAGCAAMPEGNPPAMMKSGMLVDAKGMTLYTFDRDAAGSGKSVCNGGCAQKWPPALAGDSARPSGDYTIVVRDNGQKQWAYEGKPLYTWVGDHESGDKYGDNVNKVWHIVR